MSHAGLAVLVSASAIFAWSLSNFVKEGQFVAFCGSSFWQGSRLHYTAEIACATVVPYALLTILLLVRRLLPGLVRAP